MKQFSKPIQILFILSLISLLASCSQFSSFGQGGLASPTAGLPSHYAQVALLVPLHGAYGGAGSAVRDGYLAAYYASQQRGESATTIRIYDTTKTSGIANLYRQAVTDGAQMVIGPLNRKNVATLKSSGVISVPTLALNYTSAQQSSVSNFFEFGLSTQNQAYQVANKAWNDGHRNALVIVPKSSWGASIANAFANHWQELGGNIVGNLNYSSKQNLRLAIRNVLGVDKSVKRAKALEKLINEKVSFVPQRRQDADMIFLVALPQMARKINPLLKFYYAGKLPIYSISLLYDGVINSARDRDLNGIYFCDLPWVFKDLPRMRRLQKEMARIRNNPYQNYIRLYALGLDAYLLTNRLNQLNPGASTTLDGVTGRLFLDNQQHIWQTMQWAQFQNGKPKLL